MLGTGSGSIGSLHLKRPRWMGLGRLRLVTGSFLTDHLISSSSHSQSPGFSSSFSWLRPRVPLALSLSCALVVTSPVCLD